MTLPLFPELPLTSFCLSSRSVVWTILILELLFEVIIRPKNYSELITSDKAFAPSVARHINRFHLIFEFLALLTFIPEFNCVVNTSVCDRRSNNLDRVKASLDAILGSTHAEAARGRFLLSITALRFFGVVRHWKQMWINNTFRPMKREGVEKWLFRQDLSFRQSGRSDSTGTSKSSSLKKVHNKKKEVSVSIWTSSSATTFQVLTLFGAVPLGWTRKQEWRVSGRGRGADINRGRPASEKRSDNRDGVDGSQLPPCTDSTVSTRWRTIYLVDVAATFSPSFMAFFFVLLTCLRSGIMLIMPLINCLLDQNHSAVEMVRLLQNNNIVAGNDCEYFDKAVDSWLKIAVLQQPASFRKHVESTYVLWAQVLPVRNECGVRRDDGVITTCYGTNFTGMASETCNVWDNTGNASQEEASEQFFAKKLDLRLGAIRELTMTSFNNSNYNVTVIYNENPTVELTYVVKAISTPLHVCFIF
jgi:hypothetical protein